jgi:hypothetical protein
LLLEPKDKIKARGMRSTDLVDALALTFAAPVRPEAKRRPAANTAAAKYDPYEWGPDTSLGGYDPDPGERRDDNVRTESAVAAGPAPDAFTGGRGPGPGRQGAG